MYQFTDPMDNSIILRQHEQIKHSLQILVENNKTWVVWFNECFVKWLRDGVPALYKYQISLTGSRSVNLAYPQSDLEFAIVVPSSMNKSEKENILSDVLYFYRRNDWAESYSQLKADLLLVAKNTQAGMWKVETTIRTTAEHLLIQNNMNESLETWSDENRLQYILGMQKAFLEGDEQQLAKMKGWMKILNDQQKEDITPIKSSANNTVGELTARSPNKTVGDLDDSSSDDIIGDISEIKEYVDNFFKEKFEASSKTGSDYPELMSDYLDFCTGLALEMDRKGIKEVRVNRKGIPIDVGHKKIFTKFFDKNILETTLIREGCPLKKIESHGTTTWSFKSKDIRAYFITLVREEQLGLRAAPQETDSHSTVFT